MYKAPIHKRVDKIFKWIVLVACIAFIALVGFKLGKNDDNQTQTASETLVEPAVQKTSAEKEPVASPPGDDNTMEAGTRIFIEEPVPAESVQVMEEPKADELDTEPNNEKWRIRFDHCKAKWNCKKTVDNLLDKGIETAFNTQNARTVNYWIRIGPWSAINDAKRAGNLLKSKGIFTYYYQGKKGHYVKTVSRSDLEIVNNIEGQLNNDGYTVKVIKWTSARDMFSVFGKEQYNTSDEVNARHLSLLDQGIENIFQIASQ